MYKRQSLYTAIGVPKSELWRNPVLDLNTRVIESGIIEKMMPGIFRRLREKAESEGHLEVDPVTRSAISTRQLQMEDFVGVFAFFSILLATAILA